MRIETLLESGANVAITVTPTDLKEFALSLINEAINIGSKQKTPESYLTQKEAAREIERVGKYFVAMEENKVFSAVKGGQFGLL